MSNKTRKMTKMSCGFPVWQGQRGNYWGKRTFGTMNWLPGRAHHIALRLALAGLS
jgi:hypothetical protein